MANIYKAKDLNEAVEMARKFKERGTYNLFRGQAQDWEVVSSAGRLSDIKFEEAKEVLHRLAAYFETSPSLKKFRKDVDWFYSVAQHYGIPTNYIDFTASVDIAAFFATNSKSNRLNLNCTIICLNEKDFKSFIKFTDVLYKERKVVPPYIAKINVDNLWRLQAQSGCFLFTPFGYIEYFYQFDKIVFPFTDCYKGVMKSDVYPIRKSELEILLDHFFNAEQRLAGRKRFESFVKKMEIPSWNIESPDIKMLLKKKEENHTWLSKDFENWHYPVKEVWISTDKTISLKLNVSIKETKESQFQSLRNQLTTFFASNQIGRITPLQFEIVTKPKLSKKTAKVINRSCARIWDGTRNLPFTNNEIYDIICKYIYLEIYENQFDEISSLSGEDLIALEFMNEYGSITRCMASPNKVVSSFRDDIKEILVEELTQKLTSEILLHINIANLIFDFNKLVEFFKDEAIAYQVLYNSENENPVIFYTPSQVSIIGYA